MSEKDTEMWIKLTEVAANTEFTRNHLSEINGKIDESNRIMRKEMKEEKEERRKLHEEIILRIEKLEQSKAAILSVVLFIVGFGGLVAWASSLYKDLKG
jgi:hypothetical protein